MQATGFWRGDRLTFPSIYGSVDQSSVPHIAHARANVVSPASVEAGARRGDIVAIGGAIADQEILSRFVALCGGRRSRIIILPTASQSAEIGPHYERLFKELGAEEARALHFESRADCETSAWLHLLGRADGIFLTGGSQLRLSTTIGGTSVARLVRRMNAEGVPVAGTSAGAAFLSEHMIAFGEEGSTPHVHGATMAPGLGLTNRVVVDQHFRQRDRLGRLLTALAYNPFAVGLGLDEDTAAFIDPDDVIHVVGRGGITVVDPSGVEYSSMAAALQHPQKAVCLIGVVLHALVAGATYDLRERKARPPGIGGASRMQERAVG